MTVTNPTPRFTSVYDATLARFVVERGPCQHCAQGHALTNGEHKFALGAEPCGIMHVVPSSDEMSRAADPDGAKRAQQVCETLNRVYAPSGAAPQP